MGKKRKRKKKSKLKKLRDLFAISAWFRNSAGPMKSKKYKRKSKHKKDFTEES
jgi:hypothetical protein